MKHHDPFDLPDDEKKELRKKMKKVLTKKEVFDILDEEIKEIESLPGKTWGFLRDDIYLVIEKIKNKIQELEDE
tara:strand:- start:184 stop:405 length:222 start_codon:yes stop_codon:yes gene_type:complete